MGDKSAEKMDRVIGNGWVEKKPQGINPNEPDEYGYSSVWE